MNESWSRIGSLFTSNVEPARLHGLCHVTHANEPCLTYEWVMSQYVWVMAHIWMSHGTHMNQPRHTYEWLMSHIWMSHGTHMNESCHTCECVIGHNGFYLHFEGECVLQCVAVCCSVLQCVAVCCSVFTRSVACVAVCCSVLPCIAVYCNMLQSVAVCCSVMQCVAASCSVLCTKWGMVTFETDVSRMNESCHTSKYE